MYKISVVDLIVLEKKTQCKTVLHLKTVLILTDFGVLFGKCI